MIIGIVAKKGCGKTTVANVLCRELSGTKLAFGHPVKLECITFLDEIEALYYPGYFYGTDEDKNKNIIIPGRVPLEILHYGFLDWAVGTIVNGKTALVISYRKMMQFWGTEYRRAQNENYWNEKMMEMVGDVKEDTPIIIDDVRFKDEAELIKTLGGTIIKIKRDTGITDDHRSEIEQEMIRPFITIDNCRGLDELEALTKDAAFIIQGM